MSKKCICLLCCFLFIMLSACRNSDDKNLVNMDSYFTDSEYNYDTDWQYYYGVDDLKINVTASSDGYYTCSENGFTLFLDKTTLQLTPLCGKPNCNHSDRTICDAYIKNVITGGMGLCDGTGMSSMVQYYKGKLYFVIEEYNDITMSYDQYLASADLDGSNIKKVSEKIDFGRRVSSWIIHRDCFYGILSNAVYRIFLNNNKTEKIFSIENYNEGSNVIRRAVVYGDNMYIKYAILNEDDYGNVSYSGKYTDICVDLNTKKYSECRYKGKEIFISTFVNGKVLFSCESDKKGMKDYYYTDQSFNDFEELITLPIGETITTDGRYYYKDDGKELLLNSKNGNEFNKPEAAGDYYGQTITVFDMDMNEVDSFIIPSKKYYDFIAPQDPNVFILFLPDDEIQNKYHISVIEKSKIGTFNGKPAELTDVGEWG